MFWIFPFYNVQMFQMFTNVSQQWITNAMSQSQYCNTWPIFDNQTIQCPTNNQPAQFRKVVFVNYNKLYL